MASTCNLLDAAACLAGVPLLALVAVLAQSGDVNPAAFTREFNEAQRKAIIERSQHHKFVAADYEAIQKGLDDLGDKGAVRAWHFVESLYPGNLLYLRLLVIIPMTGRTPSTIWELTRQTESCRKHGRTRVILECEKRLCNAPMDDVNSVGSLVS